MRTVPVLFSILVVLAGISAEDGQELREKRFLGLGKIFGKKTTTPPPIYPSYNGNGNPVHTLSYNDGYNQYNGQSGYNGYNGYSGYNGYNNNNHYDNPKHGNNKYTSNYGYVNPAYQPRGHSYGYDSNSYEVYH